jgi:pimeloyl-ACP methyl ester carboxylesterase
VSDMWSDFVNNLVHNPLGLLEIGQLAARADLLEEMKDLRIANVPVLALRGHADGVVPLSTFEAMCAAIGTEGRVVTGNHSFLLADPAAFDEVMANLLTVASPDAKPDRGNESHGRSVVSA